jgi:hypothetical protein
MHYIFNQQFIFTGMTSFCEQKQKATLVGKRMWSSSLCGGRESRTLPLITQDIHTRGCVACKNVTLFPYLVIQPLHSAIIFKEIS